MELFKRQGIGMCPCCGEEGNITIKFHNTEYVQVSNEGLVRRFRECQNHIGKALCSTCLKSYAAIDLSNLIGIPGVIRVVPYENLNDVLISYLKVYGENVEKVDSSNPILKSSVEGEVTYF